MLQHPNEQRSTCCLDARPCSTYCLYDCQLTLVWRMSPACCCSTLVAAIMSVAIDTRLTTRRQCNTYRSNQNNAFEPSSHLLRLTTGTVTPTTFGPSSHDGIHVQCNHTHTKHTHTHATHEENTIETVHTVSSLALAIDLSSGWHGMA